MSSGLALACLNETGTNRQGETIALSDRSAEEWRESLKTPTSRARLVTHSRRVIERARKEPNPENLNDLAVVLVRLGRSEEAIRLLQFNESRKPGGYRTAANIGTAYELSGDNEQALRWIREGIRRNPESHWGSEWLHVRILEAKIEASKGRPAPARGSILGLDFGAELVPRRPTRLPVGNDGKPLSLFALANGIKYQLHERTQFVPPRDAIIAGLFFDWGNVEFAAGSIELADVAYDYALQYGHAERELIARRRNEIARILAKAKRSPERMGECETCDPPDMPPARD
ncbi:tetratricopeptide repeat protein [Arenimonas sp.]|uniref:tetratricopeptide repeat protein n=1 Tax=Arenimonas sp. TaxID=1872635 RepID=UPI0039E3E544